MGILSSLNRARKKATKKVLNPFVKGFSKVSDKLLPNELRFMAPYAAGIGTLMLPGTMGPLYRALAAGGMNMAGQIAADETPIEDISDLNALSVAIATGLGATGSDKFATKMRSGIEGGLPEGMSPGESMARFGTTEGAPVGFLQGAENVSREGLASLGDYVTGTRETLANFGKNPTELMSLDGAKDALSALGPTISQGTGDVFREAAIDYRDEADRIRAEEEAQIAETTTANDQEAADLTMRYYREAGHDEETIQEALAVNNLSEYYEPPVEEAAQGGIIGLKHGGMLNFGGREMDLRGGGFVPIGKKERADDVPARLSKNEFVMTADAVRAAGGGDVNKGAQRMYNVMNNLEART